MRVRCKSNRALDLVPPYTFPGWEHSEQIFHLTPGNLYTVYAIGFEGGGAYFYIADDMFIDGPRYHAACLFDIEDPSVCRDWVLALERTDSDHRIIFAPPEWLREPWFFNRVVDRKVGAVRTFMVLRERLDGEAGGDG